MCSGEREICSWVMTTHRQPVSVSGSNTLSDKMFPNDYLCALFLYLITVLSSQIKITNIQPESLYKGLTTFTGAMKG